MFASKVSQGNIVDPGDLPIRDLVGLANIEQVEVRIAVEQRYQVGRARCSK